MSEDTFGKGVVGKPFATEFNSTQQAAWVWGLMAIVGSVGAWHVRHDTAALTTVPVLMVLIGACLVMYAVYEWSGVIVPSLVFAGISVFRVLNLGIDPSFLSQMYPYGWITVLLVSSLLLTVAVRRTTS